MREKKNDGAAKAVSIQIEQTNNAFRMSGEQ